MDFLEFVLYSCLIILVICFLILLPFAVYILYAMKRAKQDSILRAFRDQCEQAGIASVNTPDLKQNAISIAQSLNIDYGDNIEQFFQKAMLVGTSKIMGGDEERAMFYFDCLKQGACHMKKSEDAALAQNISTKYFKDRVNAVYLFNFIHNQYDQPKYAQKLNAYQKKFKRRSDVEYALFYLSCEINGISKSSVKESPQAKVLSSLLRFYTKDLYQAYCDAETLLKNFPEIIRQITDDDLLTIRMYADADVRGNEYIKALKSKGIYSIVTKKNRQEAMMLSRKYGFNFSVETNIDAQFDKFYEAAIENYERWCMLEKFSQYVKVLRDELDSITTEKKFTEPYRSLTTAQQKRVYMLEREIAPIEKQMKDLRFKMNNEERLMGVQKERDWASWGGAASAIAGPAAGVMVASDIQNENQKIRAQNEILQIAAIYKRQKDYEEYEKAEQKLIEIRSAIAAAKQAVEHTLSKEDMVSLISIKQTIDVVSHHFIQVKIDMNSKEEVKIANIFPAVIDGVISAQVYLDSNLIGESLLVLPYEGINTKIVSYTFKVPCFQASSDRVSIKLSPIFISKIDQATGYCSPAYNAIFE